MERGTHWYYERARGSYLDDKARQGTPTRQKEWARQNPKFDFSAPTDEGLFAYAFLCDAMVKRYGTNRAGWPSSIVIPWFTQFAGQDKPIAGQTGGRMGESFRPFLVKGDPSHRDFEVPGLRLPEDVPLHRALADD